MASATETHDARKVLSDLRDHLARHDKPIAFLFGAGTSCSVRVPSEEDSSEKVPLIPAVAELTAICKAEVEKIDEKFKEAWSSLEKDLQDDGQTVNVETVLSRLRMMLNAIGSGDKLVGLNRGEIAKLEETVRKTIARVVTPGLDSLPEKYAHQLFAGWLGKASRQNPVEIFTLNYDVLIERAIEAERIPIFDGFVGSLDPFFHPDSIRRSDSAPGANWVRLWKLHGSVTWRRAVSEGHIRVVRGGADQTGEMIYPSFQKYDESRQLPYSALTERLTRFLEQENALLIVCGYSFGDEHINNLVFGALEHRQRTHVYALQFDEQPDDSDLVRRAKRRSNLIVCGPTTGVIGGRRLHWSAAESPDFMNIVFEVRSNSSETDNDQNHAENIETGYMKVGDFHALSEFLASMSSET